MKCPKCQSEDTHVLSTGEILCLNEKCFAVSVPEKVVQNQSPDVNDIEDRNLHHRDTQSQERIKVQGSPKVFPDTRKGLEEEWES